MMHSGEQARRQRGVTVVEVMVALVLGLILLGGILQVYLGSKSSYRFSEGLGRLQEDSRLAFDLMAQDIRMAGYVPCGVADTASVVVDEAGDQDWWLPFFEQPIRGFEGGSSIYPNAVDSPGLDESSDALLVLRGGAKVASISRYDEVNERFVLQRDLGSDWVSAGELMIACDQDVASLFQAGAIDTGNDVSVPDDVTRVSTRTGSIQPGNCTSKLGFPGPAECDTANGAGGTSYSFGEDGFLSNVAGVIYYIKEASFGDGKSLYREYVNVNDGGSISLRSDSEELVSGVESLQIEYGLDLVGGDQVADRYVTADAVGDDEWVSVVTVRLGMLFASADRVSRQVDKKTYYVAGTAIAAEGTDGDLNHAEDRRIRLASNTLVQVRN